MTRRKRTPSAGLLLYRRREDGLEVFLVRLGNPFVLSSVEANWTIPKGSPRPRETLLQAAQREFKEETGAVARPPFFPLESATQAQKLVTAWAWEGELEPELCSSHEVVTEWPAGSGNLVRHREVAAYRWFTLREAKRKIIPAQTVFLERLAAVLK
jgi:predicted NUDIX family NTP pyrophosphohydrolase